MKSNNYKDRFKAEYYQLKIRKEKLQKMLNNWDSLNFEPSCSKDFYDFQLDIMRSYIRLLKHRARKENIELD
jgi:hypothetical protein